MSSHNNYTGPTPTGSGFNGGGQAGSGSNYPVSPTSSKSMMPQFIQDPSMKGISFDQLLQNRGIRFIHKLALPCPNMKTIFDNSHRPNCTICNGNGMFYYREREIWGVFHSNSIEKNFEMQGLWEVGTAVVTLPNTYPDGSQADFGPYDQLVIPDFTVRLWEMKAYEPSVDNKQKLRYPIHNVDYACSVKDNVVKEFSQDTDFNVADGKIQWIPGQTPDYDSINARGDVLAISYFANPVYSVVQQLRELRVTQEFVNGQKVPLKLPQQVLVKRDFLVGLPEKE